MHLFYVQIRKRDADLFGSDDHPIPPSCLITVFAEQAEDTEKHLSYAISLKGVDSDAQKIYIDRFLEKGTTGMCYQIIIIVIPTETVSSNVFDAGHSAIKPDSNTGKLHNNSYYILPLTKFISGIDPGCFRWISLHYVL